MIRNSRSVCWRSELIQPRVTVKRLLRSSAYNGWSRVSGGEGMPSIDDIGAGLTSRKPEKSAPTSIILSVAVHSH
jgi:hypothetical protein